MPHNVLLRTERREEITFSPALTMLRGTAEACTPVAEAEVGVELFLTRCTEVIERYMDDPAFNIAVLCRELGLSHSTLYKKIKQVTGLSLNGFIRRVRLMKAALLLAEGNRMVAEAAAMTGFGDIKYFRKQFFMLFGRTPSVYSRDHKNIPGNPDLYW